MNNSLQCFSSINILKSKSSSYVDVNTIFLINEQVKSSHIYLDRIWLMINDMLNGIRQWDDYSRGQFFRRWIEFLDYFIDVVKLEMFKLHLEWKIEYKDWIHYQQDIVISAWFFFWLIFLLDKYQLLQITIFDQWK